MSKGGLRLAALGVSATLVLGACGGGGDAEAPAATTSPTPTSTVNVPEGISLTGVGDSLSFGETATVIHEPNQKRGTVLSLTVDGVTQGSSKDLSAFVLDDYTKAATPYYATVRVKNVGEGDVSGSPVPLWGVDATNTLLPAATFTSRFATCPSEPLPRGFTPGKTFKTCLVFLAPDAGKLEAVSFRPNQEFDPIRWTGDITTPKPAAQKSKKGQPRKGKKAGR